jgi:hypothetical protein
MCVLETSRIGAPYIYDISHLRVNQQSEYNVVHKLMSWQESSLWTISY